jgi:hypothetical protein
VVHAGRLEVDVLDGPPHRPVDLPDQLALEVGGQVGEPLVARDVTDVGEVGGVLVVRRERDGVAAAVAAVGLVGEAGEVPAPRCLVLVGGLQLDGLGAVPGEHGLDRVPLADGREHGVAVVTGPVALGLRDLVHVDAHRVQRVAQRGLEVLGPGVVAAVGIGDRRQGPADVVAPRGVDADRDLAEPVVVVPDVQVTGPDPAPAQLLGDEVDGEELPQVAEVDPAGRARAGGDGDDLGVTASITGCVPQRVVGGTGHPVVGLTGLLGHGRRRYRPVGSAASAPRSSRGYQAGTTSEYAAGSTRQVRWRSGP